MSGAATSLGYNAGTSSLGLDQTESTHVTGGLFQSTSSTNNYASFQPGGANSLIAAAFGIFSGGIEGTFDGGTASSILDLYELVPGPLAPGPPFPPSEFTGTFSINDSALVTFTPAALVPEPTIATALAGGGVFLASLRRRRARAKIS